MKKTQQKDAVRNIRKRLVSYLSVCLVVMLGLGGFFTARYMGTGIERQAGKFYNEHDFKDFDLVSSYGITEGNLEKFRQVDKVTAVEGVLQADGSVTFNGEKRNVTIVSLTENVSVPSLKEGELPQGRDECLVGEDFAEVEGLKVGDKIRVSLTGLTAMKDSLKSNMTEGMTDADGNPVTLDDEEDEEGSDDPLYSKEFTITGLMVHPDFLRRKSTNTVGLPLSAFNTKATEGLYTHAFVRIEQPEKAGMFKQAYFDKTEDTRHALEKTAEELEAIRTQEVKDQAYAYIDEEWAKAEAKLADGQAQIDSGEAQLNSKLAEGRNKLNKAQRELNKKVAEYNKKIKDGEKQIAEAKKMIAMLDKYLGPITDMIEDIKAKYGKDLDDLARMLDRGEAIINEIDRITDKTSDAYKQKVAELAGIVIDNQEALEKIQEVCTDEEIVKLVQDIKDKTNGVIDLTDEISKLASYDVNDLVDMATRIKNGQYEYADRFVEKMRGYITTARSLLSKLKAAEELLAKYQRGEFHKMIADKEAELAAGKKKLAAEKKKYQRMINAGWSKYYSEKAKYESKLEEAKALLATNRELAEQKLAEARAEVGNIDQCEWIVLDRKGNAGYVDIKANIDAVAKMGVVFGILFTIITAIVCFSTLMIIIDEQKTLVGTVKAFGFFKREVLGKYLVFGVSAALVGSLLAMLLAYGLSSFVQVRYAASGMYPIGVAKSYITPVSTILFTLLITAVNIAATVIACSDILRSPASLLMKGAVLKKEKPGKKEKTVASSKGGSLYSRLILRNMIQDKSRVLVTVAIIAFSCMLIGIGITMKLAYDGMMNRQVSDVNKFDIRMDMNEDVTDEDEKALVEVLERNGADFMPATYSATLYNWNSKLDGVQIVCGNPDRINEFYGIADYRTGKPVPLPEDGILIQKRMHESYGMDTGDELILLDKSLGEHKATIKGTFANYVGRTVVMSPAVYKDIFGEEAATNTYFIKLNGASLKTVEEELLNVSDNISFVKGDEFKTKFESASRLYNILVLITTGIAILISFMILTNLANIYLNRKKTELTVMRVNGFSVKQVKGYLSKESFYTTTAGLVLGVVIGAILTPNLIKTMQQPDLEFVKSFQVIAWAAAVVLEALFSVIINNMVYRKIKDLNLKDIA